VFDPLDPFDPGSPHTLFSLWADRSPAEVSPAAGFFSPTIETRCDPTAGHPVSYFFSPIAQAAENPHCSFVFFSTAWNSMHSLNPIFSDKSFFPISSPPTSLSKPASIFSCETSLASPSSFQLLYPGALGLDVKIPRVAH